MAGREHVGAQRVTGDVEMRDVHANSNAEGGSGSGGSSSSSSSASGSGNISSNRSRLSSESSSSAPTWRNVAYGATALLALGLLGGTGFALARKIVKFRAGRMSRARNDFLQAACDGDIDKLVDHIRAGRDLSCADKNGSNALMLAAWAGRREAVMILLHSSADVHAVSQHGWTALTYAARAGEAGTVEALLEWGADVNVVENTTGATPLMFAAFVGSLECVELLLSYGANPLSGTRQGALAFAFAEENGHEGIAGMLRHRTAEAQAEIQARKEREEALAARHKAKQAFMLRKKQEQAYFRRIEEQREKAAKERAAYLASFEGQMEMLSVGCYIPLNHATGRELVWVLMEKRWNRTAATAAQAPLRPRLQSMSASTDFEPIHKDLLRRRALNSLSRPMLNNVQAADSDSEEDAEEDSEEDLSDESMNDDSGQEDEDQDTDDGQSAKRSNHVHVRAPSSGSIRAHDRHQPPPSSLEGLLELVRPALEECMSKDPQTADPIYLERLQTAVKAVSFGENDLQGSPTWLDTNVYSTTDQAAYAALRILSGLGSMAASYSARLRDTSALSAARLRMPYFLQVEAHLLPPLAQILVLMTQLHAYSPPNMPHEIYHRAFRGALELVRAHLATIAVLRLETYTVRELLAVLGDALLVVALGNLPEPGDVKSNQHATARDRDSDVEEEEGPATLASRIFANYLAVMSRSSQEEGRFLARLWKPTKDKRKLLLRQHISEAFQEQRAISYLVCEGADCPRPSSDVGAGRKRLARVLGVFDVQRSAGALVGRRPASNDLLRRKSSNLEEVDLRHSMTAGSGALRHPRTSSTMRRESLSNRVRVRSVLGEHSSGTNSTLLKRRSQALLTIQRAAKAFVAAGKTRSERRATVDSGAGAARHHKLDVQTGSLRSLDITTGTTASPRERKVIPLEDVEAALCSSTANLWQGRIPGRVAEWILDTRAIVTRGVHGLLVSDEPQRTVRADLREDAQAMADELAMGGFMPQELSLWQLSNPHVDASSGASSSSSGAASSRAGGAKLLQVLLDAIVENDDVDSAVVLRCLQDDLISRLLVILKARRERNDRPGPPLTPSGSDKVEKVLLDHCNKIFSACLQKCSREDQDIVQGEDQAAENGRWLIEDVVCELIERLVSLKDWHEGAEKLHAPLLDLLQASYTPGYIRTTVTVLLCAFARGRMRVVDFSSTINEPMERLLRGKLFSRPAQASPADQEAVEVFLQDLARTPAQPVHQSDAQALHALVSSRSEMRPMTMQSRGKPAVLEDVVRICAAAYLKHTGLAIFAYDAAYGLADLEPTKQNAKVNLLPKPVIDIWKAAWSATHTIISVHRDHQRIICAHEGCTHAAVAEDDGGWRCEVGHMSDTNKVEESQTYQEICADVAARARILLNQHADSRAMAMLTISMSQASDSDEESMGNDTSSRDTPGRISGLSGRLSNAPQFEQIAFDFGPMLKHAQYFIESSASDGIKPDSLELYLKAKFRHSRFRLAALDSVQSVFRSVLRIHARAQRQQSEFSLRSASTRDLGVAQSSNVLSVASSMRGERLSKKESLSDVTPAIGAPQAALDAVLAAVRDIYAAMPRPAGVAGHHPLDYQMPTDHAEAIQHASMDIMEMLLTVAEKNECVDEISLVLEVLQIISIRECDHEEVQDLHIVPRLIALLNRINADFNDPYLQGCVWSVFTRIALQAFFSPWLDSPLTSPRGDGTASASQMELSDDLDDEAVVEDGAAATDGSVDWQAGFDGLQCLLALTMYHEISKHVTTMQDPMDPRYESAERLCHGFVCLLGSLCCNRRIMRMFAGLFASPNAEEAPFRAGNLDTPRRASAEYAPASHLILALITCSSPRVQQLAIRLGWRLLLFCDASDMTPRLFRVAGSWALSLKPQTPSALSADLALECAGMLRNLAVKGRSTWRPAILRAAGAAAEEYLRTAPDCSQEVLYEFWTTLAVLDMSSPSTLRPGCRVKVVADASGLAGWNESKPNQEYGIVIRSSRRAASATRPNEMGALAGGLEPRSSISSYASETSSCMVILDSDAYRIPVKCDAEKVLPITILLEEFQDLFASLRGSSWLLRSVELFTTRFWSVSLQQDLVWSELKSMCMSVLHAWLSTDASHAIQTIAASGTPVWRNLVAICACPAPRSSLDSVDDIISTRQAMHDIKSVLGELAVSPMEAMMERARGKAERDAARKKAFAAAATAAARSATSSVASSQSSGNELQAPEPVTGVPLVANEERDAGTLVHASSRGSDGSKASDLGSEDDPFAKAIETTGEGAKAQTPSKASRPRLQQASPVQGQKSLLAEPVLAKGRRAALARQASTQMFASDIAESDGDSDTGHNTSMRDQKESGQDTGASAGEGAHTNVPPMLNGSSVDDSSGGPSSRDHHTEDDSNRIEYASTAPGAFEDPILTDTTSAQGSEPRTPTSPDGREKTVKFESPAAAVLQTPFREIDREERINYAFELQVERNRRRARMERKRRDAAALPLPVELPTVDTMLSLPVSSQKQGGPGELGSQSLRLQPLRAVVREGTLLRVSQYETGVVKQVEQSTGGQELALVHICNSLTGMQTTKWRNIGDLELSEDIISDRYLLSPQDSGLRGTGGTGGGSPGLSAFSSPRGRRSSDGNGSTSGGSDGSSVGAGSESAKRKLSSELRQLFTRSAILNARRGAVAAISGSVGSASDTGQMQLLLGEAGGASQILGMLKLCESSASTDVPQQPLSSGLDDQSSETTLAGMSDSGGAAVNGLWRAVAMLFQTNDEFADMLLDEAILYLSITAKNTLFFETPHPLCPVEELDVGVTDASSDDDIGSMLGSMDGMSHASSAMHVSELVSPPASPRHHHGSTLSRRSGSAASDDVRPPTSVGTGVGSFRSNSGGASPQPSDESEPGFPTDGLPAPPPLARSKRLSGSQRFCIQGASGLLVEFDRRSSVISDATQVTLSYDIQDREVITVLGEGGADTWRPVVVSGDTCYMHWSVNQTDILGALQRLDELGVDIDEVAWGVAVRVRSLEDVANADEMKVLERPFGWRLLQVVAENPSRVLTRINCGAPFFQTAVSYLRTNHLAFKPELCEVLTLLVKARINARVNSKTSSAWDAIMRKGLYKLHHDLLLLFDEVAEDGFTSVSPYFVCLLELLVLCRNLWALQDAPLPTNSRGNGATNPVSPSTQGNGRSGGSKDVTRSILNDAGTRSGAPALLATQDSMGALTESNPMAEALAAEGAPHLRPNGANGNGHARGEEKEQSKKSSRDAVQGMISSKTPKAPLCTLVVFGCRENSKMVMDCETCHLTGPDAVCLACAATCHAGHVLRNERTTTAPCGCSMRGPEACGALRPFADVWKIGPADRTWFDVVCQTADVIDCISNQTRALPLPFIREAYRTCTDGKLLRLCLRSLEECLRSEVQDTWWDRDARHMWASMLDQGMDSVAEVAFGLKVLAGSLLPAAFQSWWKDRQRDWFNKIHTNQAWELAQAMVQLNFALSSTACYPEWDARQQNWISTLAGIADLGDANSCTYLLSEDFPRPQVYFRCTTCGGMEVCETCAARHAQAGHDLIENSGAGFCDERTQLPPERRKPRVADFEYHSGPNFERLHDLYWMNHEGEDDVSDDQVPTEPRTLAALLNVPFGPFESLHKGQMSLSRLRPCSPEANSNLMERCLEGILIELLSVKEGCDLLCVSCDADHGFSLALGSLLSNGQPPFGNARIHGLVASDVTARRVRSNMHVLRTDFAVPLGPIDVFVGDLLPHARAVSDFGRRARRRYAKKHGFVPDHMREKRVIPGMLSRYDRIFVTGVCTEEQLDALSSLLPLDGALLCPMVASLRYGIYVQRNHFTGECERRTLAPLYEDSRWFRRDIESLKPILQEIPDNYWEVEGGAYDTRVENTRQGRSHGHVAHRDSLDLIDMERRQEHESPPDRETDAATGTGGQLDGQTFGHDASAASAAAAVAASLGDNDGSGSGGGGGGGGGVDGDEDRNGRERYGTEDDNKEGDEDDDVEGSLVNIDSESESSSSAHSQSHATHYHNASLDAVTDEVVEAAHRELVEQVRKDDALMEKIAETWQLDGWIALADFANKLVGRETSTLGFRDLNATSLQAFPILQDEADLEVTRGRFAVLKRVNDSLSEVLPLINLTPRYAAGGIGKQLSRTRTKRLIFLSTKLDAWSKVLEPMWSDAPQRSIPSITVSRKLADIGLVEDSLFMQTYNQVQTFPLCSLRRRDQSFKVRFAGEGGQDLGGLYRDLISEICSEIRSGRPALLFQPPLMAKSQGEAMLPRPSLKNPVELRLFEFLGTLLGIACLRHGVTLALDVSPLVWKALVRDRLVESDLRYIDDVALQRVSFVRRSTSLEEISFVLEDTVFAVAPSDANVGAGEGAVEGGASSASDGNGLDSVAGTPGATSGCLDAGRMPSDLSPSRDSSGGSVVAALAHNRVGTDLGSMGMSGEGLPAASSATNVVELCPLGKERKVVPRNALEYADLLESFRLSEVNMQLDALKRGLAPLVPARLLPMFNWQELQSLCCGVADVDVEFLHSRTKYIGGVRVTDRAVKFLWDVLGNDFSPEDRTQFLRFVWGRERMSEVDEITFTIGPHLQARDSGDPDKYLPQAHTCFMSLSLPNYSSKEILRKRLHFAIYNCNAIDADDTGEGNANRGLELS
ncbi:E3 ubiquitin-protein ligase HERC2 [Hondaea fermentalgiana]|uniref:E3 ubiquitin-protein ligase HERC2 n=1 Tax=Hondaea fermentalgiana TaxID=2315210 RepID=A0A2R5G693_9STRA|nr:E3 ubiquitin-protein ligase HERC2 [Hondaea fermentalgiana]|eukprot:GBG25849.1 E3 ubiquitin-protein ligase HERC2 [Hondaea fermentalgiana]